MIGHNAGDRTAAVDTGTPRRDPVQQAADVALRRTNKFLEEGIAQTHQLLSLLHQRAATAPSATAPATTAAAAVGSDQALDHGAQRLPHRPAASDMDIILLTTQLLCSWQAASTAVQSVPAFPAANSAAEPMTPTCQRQDCRDQAGKLRIRLAAAVSEVSMLRGQMSQPFALPEPHIPAQERQRPSLGPNLSQQSRVPPSSVQPSHSPFTSPSRPHSVYSVQEDPLPPPRKRRRSASPSSAHPHPESRTTSSKIPAPRKPHAFAGRLATAARSYHQSRYDNGRLTLATSPSTAVLAHHLVPTRKLSQSTIQGYITAIMSSKGSTSELMHTVLAAILTSDPTSPLTIDELHMRHHPAESNVSAWTQYALRWSVWPMVAVKVLDANRPEFAPHWRALLDSLSPAEAQYIQGNKPHMVLIVGVDWIGYPMGMFADSPALDVHTTSVGLCERYGLVVGELGVVPDVTISLVSQLHPPRRPASALVSATPAPHSFAAPSILAAPGHGTSPSSSSSTSGRGFMSNTGASPARPAARTVCSSDSDDPLQQSELADTDDNDNDSDSDSDSDSDDPHALTPRHHRRVTTHSSSPHTPAATQPNESSQIATPASLLTFRKLDCRIGRYVNGQPRVRGGRTALANELIPARTWTAAQVQANLVAINASSGSTSISRRVLAYAFARGPSAPFSLAELVAEQIGVVAQRQILVQQKLRPAVNAALVGHVQVLERLEARGDVWERLVAAAVARGVAREVATRAELVVVAGVEMVGFEAPRAEDVLPEWAERRFVVRERYAIIV